MNVQIDIIVLLLSGLVVLVLGMFLGYRLSLSRLKERFQDVAEKEKALQRRRVAAQRERYQESTSRIHRAQGEQESKNLILREELEQKKLELSILRQDMQLDLDVVRGEKESLEAEIGRLKGDDVSFSEIEHAEIPVIEGPERDEDHKKSPEKVLKRSRPTKVNLLWMLFPRRKAIWSLRLITNSNFQRYWIEIPIWTSNGCQRTFERASTMNHLKRAN